MVEGGSQEVSEAAMIDALMFAKEAAMPLIELQDRLRERAGKPKRAFSPPALDEALIQAVMNDARPGYLAALELSGKHERHDALAAVKQSTKAKFLESHPDRAAEISTALSKLEKQLVRGMVIDTGKRLDGRGLRDVRPLHIEVHPFERPHGSALFQRGETQAITTTTLGTERDAQRLDTIRGDVNNTFLLHYNFPPYCVGEARPMRGTSRREIGHGALAHRALESVLPDAETFPYTIRIVSDTTE